MVANSKKDVESDTMEAKRKIALAAVLSSLSYSFCSVSMVMSNKASLSYRFPGRVSQ